MAGSSNYFILLLALLLPPKTRGYFDERAARGCAGEGVMTGRGFLREVRRLEAVCTEKKELWRKVEDSKVPSWRYRSHQIRKWCERRSCLREVLRLNLAGGGPLV